VVPGNYRRSYVTQTGKTNKQTNRKTNKQSGTDRKGKTAKPILNCPVFTEQSQYVTYSVKKAACSPTWPQIFQGGHSNALLLLLPDGCNLNNQIYRFSAKSGRRHHHRHPHGTFFPYLFVGKYKAE